MELAVSVLDRLQTEPEDRPSGRRRSPPQPESLAAAGNNFNEFFSTSSTARFIFFLEPVASLN